MVNRGEERIPFQLYATPETYGEPVFVSVNGETCRVMRGETVMIKRKFADVLMKSLKQDYNTARMLNRMGQKAMSIDM